MLYNNDIPDQYVAKYLGHDILILKSIYQHLGLSKEREIDDKIRQLEDRFDLKEFAYVKSTLLRKS